ncbi:hypothetical protein LAV_00139 [Sphingobium phage Lacusarx]|uniref:DUF2958 domain-containing protein n=1 Tax=Sphingobium phage Lacusarx TaxID=1980139 RepID=A0A1W6DX76_9CAUD|nr:hypothetical protein FDH44_gp164 [Sphingobium phage Lacusarx]ARK07514.1 hypothetical protein LAV_00139 [Sphingobium phage Lacusarx]
MELLTNEIREKLLENGRESAATPGAVDHAPVVKLFTPDANATWLLSEIDPHNPDIAFALCDLGLGEPELGYVSLNEIKDIRGRLRLPVERDLSFKSDVPLGKWAAAARESGSIAGAETSVRAG